MRRAAATGSEADKAALERAEVRAGLRPPRIAPDCAWLPIQAGPFVMGSPASEGGRFADEDEHEVVIEKGLWISERCLVRSDFDGLAVQFTEPTVAPSGAMTSVSWTECVEACRALSEALGWPIMLPLEAEWERASRESHTRGGWLGNVWQWCADVYREKHDPVASEEDRRRAFPFEAMTPGCCAAGPGSTDRGAAGSTRRLSTTTSVSGSSLANDARVLRGGSWYFVPIYCRSAFRYWFGPSFRYSLSGFRVVVGAAGGARRA
jgi:formylglycine-generating enzyme required for sulfatase activity